MVFGDYFVEGVNGIKIVFSNYKKGNILNNEDLTMFPLTKERTNELPKVDTIRLMYNDGVIGYFLYRKGKNTFNILSVEILPQYRGKGLGKKFFALLEKTVGKDNIIAVVDCDSVDGKKYLLSCGMRELDDASPHFLIKKLG